MEIEDIEHNGITYIAEKQQIEAIRHEQLNTYDEFIWWNGNKLKKAIKEKEGKKC